MTNDENQSPVGNRTKSLHFQDGNFRAFYFVHIAIVVLLVLEAPRVAAATKATTSSSAVSFDACGASRRPIGSSLGVRKKLRSETTAAVSTIASTKGAPKQLWLGRGGDDASGSTRRTSRCSGTRLVWQRPTLDTLLPSIEGQSCVFNHNHVGRTHPLFSQQPLESVNDDGSREMNDKGPQGKSLSSSSPRHSLWRVQRYHCQAGQGEACFARVCRAAEDWNFLAHSASATHSTTTTDGRVTRRKNNKRPITKGLVATPVSVALEQPPQLRRMWTWTQVLPKLGFLPALYVVNPVAQVYATSGTTTMISTTNHNNNNNFPATATGVSQSSLQEQRWFATAYATLQDHWLAGEERVMVTWQKPSKTKTTKPNHHEDNGGPVWVEIVSMSMANRDSRLGKLLWPLVGPFQTRYFQAQLNYLQHVGRTTDRNFEEDRPCPPS